jgi:hypothetical protein
MDEDVIMENMEKENILPLTITHLVKHFGWYRIDTLTAFAKFLSHCFASEAYGTEPERYINTKDLQTACVQLKGLFIAELVTTYGLKRRDVQHLLDQLDKWERVHGPATVVPLKPKGLTAPSPPPNANANASASAAAANSKTQVSAGVSVPVQRTTPSLSL